MSNNFFSNDNVKYGNLYHDGGSGEWFDTNNVFNHVHTPVVFGHGSCPGIVVNDIWYDTFRLNFHHFDRFELGFRGYTRAGRCLLLFAL